MKAALRYGAVLLLALIFAPLIRLGWEPQSTSLVAWGFSYVAFRIAFPPSKQKLAAPLAVSVALVCLQILAVSTYGWRLSATAIEVALVSAALVWLFINQSKIAAALLILDHALEIVAGAYMAFAGKTFWWLVGILILMRVVAIYLTAELVWGEGRAAVSKTT